jgi:hypothetical protein
MFARLLNAHGASMVDSLCATRLCVPGSTGGESMDGLHLLCHVWTEAQPMFQGSYQVR